MDPKAAPVAIGDAIGGRYRIEALLGQGGMAVVYQARHTGTGRQCALKLVHPHLVARPQLMDLFIREAQVGGRIGQHPNIVDVFDAGADEARRVPFLAMELLQGETLERYSEQRGPMPGPMLVDLFGQLADALDHAHAAGIVHRDLKPSNLFLTTDRKGRPRLMVMDFGIAKVLEAESQHTATQIGTPAYAAPEQLGAMMRQLAERQGITIAPSVSPATDVWAMGLVAYELLTASPPGQFWDASTMVELPMKVALGAPDLASVRAGSKAPLLPPGFDAWFARCTHKNAAARWPSAGQAAAELARLFGASLPAVTEARPAASIPGAPQVPAAAFGPGHTQLGSPQGYGHAPGGFPQATTGHDGGRPPIPPGPAGPQIIAPPPRAPVKRSSGNAALLVLVIAGVGILGGGAALIASRRPESTTSTDHAADASVTTSPAPPDAGQAAAPTATTPPPDAMCTTTLAVSRAATGASCTIDARVAGKTGTLTYPCAGGAAQASFGSMIFKGTVKDGIAHLVAYSGFPFSDGCKWQTTQTIHGKLGAGPLSFTYNEAPALGQRGCAKACSATASVSVR